jgi:hypothetical protein
MNVGLGCTGTGATLAGVVRCGGESGNGASGSTCADATIPRDVPTTAMTPRNNKDPTRFIKIR